MKIPRVILAAVLAPLITPLAALIVFGVINALGGGTPVVVSAIPISFVLLLCAYPPMFLLGVPTYILFHRLGIGSVWGAAIMGSITTGVAYSLFVLLTDWQRGVLDVSPFLTSKWFWIFVTPLLPIGSAIAVVFWFIAERNPVKRAPRGSPEQSTS